MPSPGPKAGISTPRYSLGEIARQISDYEHPHRDQPPDGSPADPV